MHVTKEVQCSSTCSFNASPDSVAKTTSSKDVDNISSDFFNKACGNNHEECHQLSFGTHLVHEVITFFEEHKSDRVTDLQIKHHFEYMYNIHLKMCCQDITEKYKTCNWYELPECLEKGALAYALKLVHGQQIYYQIKKNMVEGITGKELFNRARTNDSNDKCND